MIRYKNTHNGMVLEVPDHYAPVYDRADNMVRLGPEPEPEPTAAEPIFDLEALTKRELREYATENGIDLAGVRDTKTALLAAIAGEEEETEPDSEPKSEE